MKMAKASEKDIDAAGNAMSILNNISSGWYPGNEYGAPSFFDEDDASHLRKFYDLMRETLDAAPGWPGRVIGGMCYVIMFDKNQIVDPAVDTLELHPRFSQLQAQRDELLEALQEVVPMLEAALMVHGDPEPGSIGHKARAAIAKATGGAA